MFQVEWAGMSCGKYLGATHESDVAPYKIWFAGYLTAFNVFHDSLADILKLTDLDGLMGEVNNFCRSHPTWAFGIAAADVANTYYMAHKAQLEQP